MVARGADAGVEVVAEEVVEGPLRVTTFLKLLKMPGKRGIPFQGLETPGKLGLALENAWKFE